MNQNIWFGKYEMIRSIGAGASGQVYLARHQRLQQLRAIKCIPKNSAYRWQSLSEAAILKSLNHPAIPVIYDIEEDEEAFYLVEEYIMGESLEAYVLHQNLISNTFLLKVGMTLCDVFQYLHTCDTPVVYQDLKPEHIIVYGDQIKIVDFGIASFVSQDNLFQAYGTARYAAPEKLLGSPVDQVSDLYGIGCILKFLWDFLPSEQKTARLQTIIGKATQAEKKKRYQSEADLFRDLSELSQKKHLQTTQKIAVVASQSGIGATHIAISCNVYLNSIGKDAFYIEEHESGHMAQLSAQPHVKFDRVTKRISYRGFQGTARTGAAVEQKIPTEGTQILDFGAYHGLNYELETCDLIIVVLGSRLWQQCQAMQCVDQLKHLKNVLFMTNYGDSRSAKTYARQLHQSVACFPLDEDPFFVSDQKRKLFDQLLNQKGWWKE